MFHLFNSLFRVEELLLSQVDGEATTSWVQATSTDPIEEELLQALPGRLDPNFIRPGKDILPVPVAGKAPDHVGVLYTYPWAPIKAGHRLVAIENAYGEIPTPGTYEIRLIPDRAIGFSSAHHIEVQVVEVIQDLDEVWPSDEVLD